MAQLKLTHLPTDQSGVLSGVRRAIITTFGRCRGKEYRLELLIKTLEVVILAARTDLKETKANKLAKEVALEKAKKVEAEVQVKEPIKPQVKEPVKQETKPKAAGDKS